MRRVVPFPFPVPEVCVFKQGLDVEEGVLASEAIGGGEGAEEVDGLRDEGLPDRGVQGGEDGSEKGVGVAGGVDGEEEGPGTFIAIDADGVAVGGGAGDADFVPGGIAL